MTPRRHTIGPMEWAAYAGLPLLLVSVLSIRQIGPILSGGLTNPDSYMRLVRLRESMRLGEPAHEVLRDGSGLGTVVHWSHLLDSLLCLIALPFTVFMDEPIAAVDPGLQDFLLETLKHFARIRRHAVIAVMHDLNHALRYFNRLILVHPESELECIESTSGAKRSLERLFGVRLSCLHDEQGDLVMLPLRRR